MPLTTSTNASTTFPERIHSACGVAMRVNLPRRNEGGQLLCDGEGQLLIEESHQVVLDGLKTLGDFEYRAGEDDGAGIKLSGLPTVFFNKKMAAGAFGEACRASRLKKDRFVIGQYFLPHDEADAARAKTLVEARAKANGLAVVGWRHLNSAVNPVALSDKSRASEPSQWQAILVPESGGAPFELEHVALKTGVDMSNAAKMQKIALHLISLSSKFVVYKGLIHPKKMGFYHHDLQDEDFTATGTEVHARFSTNTGSKPENAQPCEDIEHNGELNSAPANAAEMRDELNAKGFNGVYPEPTLSDSMQFKADLHNQMVMKGIPFIEAFIRLMPPRLSLEDLADEGYSEGVAAMLQCFRLERTGYNGPAFMTGSSMGYALAKLDESGLRPSRWGIIEDRDGHQQFHAASDDYLEVPEGGKIIKKGHLEPGGMIVITPEGDILDTKAILESVCSRYQPHYFQNVLARRTIPLAATSGADKPDTSHLVVPPTPDLNRILYAAGWDKETQDAVRDMAEHGVERVRAMGDDTDPLHSAADPAHISYFMHQLFAQVSSPSLDSTNEPEDFSLSTSLGPVLESSAHDAVSDGKAKIVLLESPILGINALNTIEHHPDPLVCAQVLDLSFAIPSPKEAVDTSPATLMSAAITHLLKAAEEAAAKPGGGILILSDRHAGPHRAFIPDVVAVAAVRKHLEDKKLIRQVSIVADSYQAAGPHHAATLLTLGAKSVYPRGAYAKIQGLFKDTLSAPGVNRPKALENYGKAIEKCLLKTMGKMGLNDVNNYINGYFVAALGLDLSADGHDLAYHPTLANIFQRLYSPLKGINLAQVASSALRRHQQAYSLDNDFTLLPHSGYYMPEENGLKHGYGPVVINAFTEWLKAEDTHATLKRMHAILKHRNGPDSPDFVDHADALFSPENGFLDPLKKDEKGYYPPDYLEQFKASMAFITMAKTIDAYRKKYPTALRDYFSIKNLDPAAIRQFLGLTAIEPLIVQRQKDIRALLFAGSMSQGALTVADPKTLGKLGAHETLTRGMNAIGAMSASGEGGEAAVDVRNPLYTTRSKQVASGRFGISAMQIMCAEEVEIKVAQGAKPGEGGQLPGLKVSIRFSAQRGGLPGTDFISPPPHHDTYSIEDLKQLIRDIKRVNPHASVSVKLVASQGIGTIAVGVAKAGADVINMAGNSGGTGAAQQSSIKHAGLPAEIGLAEVDKALRRAKKRELVKLRVSGGFKTAEDVIIAAILGADLFEFGTTAMLTLGCKMQRTCDRSCQPGVTTDGHLFKGDQLNTERYFVNMAASIQERLRELGVNSLQDLRGHTGLLELLDPKMKELYDFSAIVDRSNLPPPLSDAERAKAQALGLLELQNATEDELIMRVEGFFRAYPTGTFVSDPIHLTTQDLSFGARIAGAFVKYLEAHPLANIIVNTTGIAGQSFGFVMPKGMILNHQGSVQDGCAKSLTGGELIITTPNQRRDYRADENTIAGNALGYGASGGAVYVNGVAGHRAFVLAKGVTAVLEGAGRRAFEYMTSGTGMVLGKVGKGLCASASGGIVFVYDKDNTVKPSNSVRTASSDECYAYELVIKKMLIDHVEKTNSVKAREILASFDPSHFKVLIPKAMDKIKTLSGIIDVIKTYQLREAPITIGMQAWLEQKMRHILQEGPHLMSEINELHVLLGKNRVFSEVVCEALLCLTRGQIRATAVDMEDLTVHPLRQTVTPGALDGTVVIHRKSKKIHIVKEKEGLAERAVDSKPKRLRPVEERVKGGLDELLLDALQHISAYVAELTHNAKGCSTCGAQSCAGGEDVVTGCPGGKNINTLNTTLQRIGPINHGRLTRAQWATLREAFEIQIKKSPFIRYTGAACPAPCQDACTETIPGHGAPNPKRDGKHIGEHVHIKDIELYLDQIGRAFGWFNGKRVWSDDEVTHVFGGYDAKHADYDEAIKDFKATFRKPDPATMRRGKELIIVGSGPAAMQMAFEALRDGLTVRMYERSDKAGGLLVDGIPPHKFDKSYIKEDVAHLIDMGLELHLNSEVIYDARRGGFYVKGDLSEKPIANPQNDNQHVALCVGGGKPKDLPSRITEALPEPQQKKIIQAIDFLKAANDIDEILKSHPNPSDALQKALIEQHFAHMNPLGKKMVIIGGGDTAQDVTRLLARYFSLDVDVSRGYLTILIRGPQPTDKRGIHDSYPELSRTLTPENKLRKEEVEFVDGDALHLVEPTQIEVNALGKLTLHVSESKFKYHDQIEACPELKALSDALPRERRPRDPGSTVSKRIDDVDMVICALGFQGKTSLPIIQAIEEAELKYVSIAGDAANVKPQIIIGAQASGHDTYSNRIREALGINDERPTLSKPARGPSALTTLSMFATSRRRVDHPAAGRADDLGSDTRVARGGADAVQHVGGPS